MKSQNRQDMKFEKEIKSLKRNLLINNLLVFVFLGIVLNISVMMYNDLKMPVYYLEKEGIPQTDNSYLPFKEFSEVKYPYLSDVFQIRRLSFSIGDVLIFGGVISILIIFIYSQIINLKRRFKKWLY